MEDPFDSTAERPPSQEALRQTELEDANGYGLGGQPTIRVESDLPDELPVTREVLDILERYFGDIIDEVLGDQRL